MEKSKTIIKGLKEMLETKYQKLKQVKEEIVKLKNEEIELTKEVNGLYAALKSFGAKEFTEEKAPKNRFVGITIADACLIVLKETNRPMTTGELVNALQEGGLLKDTRYPKNAISTTLKRDPDTFEVAGRAMFKLREEEMEGIL